jgi:hypothetical protein
LKQEVTGERMGHTMRTKYVVRQLMRNDYASAAGMRFVVYELLSDSAQRVALFYEEAEAFRVCKALQQFGEKGTRPLGANPIFSVSLADNNPQSMA